MRMRVECCVFCFVGGGAPPGGGVLIGRDGGGQGGGMLAQQLNALVTSAVHWTGAVASMQQA